MKFKKLVGGHMATIVFIGALVILFMALSKLLSGVEEFSELSQTMIVFIRNIIGR